MKRLSSRLAAVVVGGGCALALVLGATPSLAASDGKQSATSSGSTAAVAERDAYAGPPLVLGGGRKPKVGAYGSIGGAYTRLIGRDSGLVSLEGALLLDHRLSLGLAGYGFTRTPGGPVDTDGARREFAAGYGGLAVRYAIFGPWPVYGTVGLVLGAGAVNLHRARRWTDDSQWDAGFDTNDGEWDEGRFDPFLFAQPEIALNANMTRWLRLGATLGYRFTGGVSRFGLSESDLNGVCVGANFALGWF
jgi:hypothetical protein